MIEINYKVRIVLFTESYKTNLPTDYNYIIYIIQKVRYLRKTLVSMAIIITYLLLYMKMWGKLNIIR